MSSAHALKDRNAERRSGLAVDVAHLEAAPTALAAPHGSRSSFLPAEAKLGAAVVAAAGASLGAFSWYVLATHGRNGSNFFLVASVVAGILISLGLWLAYARVASRMV